MAVVHTYESPCTQQSAGGALGRLDSVNRELVEQARNTDYYTDNTENTDSNTDVEANQRQQVFTAIRFIFFLRCKNNLRCHSHTHTHTYTYEMLFLSNFLECW